MVAAMKQVIDLKIKVMKQTILVAIILTALLLVFGYFELAYGFFFGTVIAIVNWLLLARTMERSTTFSPRKAQFYAVTHYILRFAIIFIAAYIAAMRPDMHVVGTLIALFVPKATILWDHVIKGFWLKKREQEE